MMCERLSSRLVTLADPIPPRSSFKNKDDLVEAVDALQPMMASRLLGNVPSLRTGMWDSAVYNSKEHYWPDHQGRPVPEEIELEILRKEDLGYW